MSEPGEPLYGARAIGVVDVVIGVAIAAVGVLVLSGAVAAYGAPVDNPLFDRQLPLIAGASLAVLGATVALVGVALFRKTEKGRAGAIGVAALAIGTVYLQIHLASILFTGTPFRGELVVVFGALVATLAYAGPILIYLTQEEVAERTRRVSRLERPEAADEIPADRRLDPEPVEGGETLEPPVVRGEKITSRGIPDHAVAKTQCTMCGTDLAVPTARRPLVVECTACGTHGHLSARPTVRPAARRRRPGQTGV